MPISRARKRVGLFVWVAVAFLPSAIAAFVETGAWYESLAKPSWTPPSWVFGPVWTVLYLMMGVAAWRVWLRGGGGMGDGGTRRALGLFLVHLLFNAAWTWLFFGLHLLTAAAVEIVVLWVMVGVLVVMFWRRDRAAGALMLPYWAWVGYAVTLSVGFARLNGG